MVQGLTLIPSEFHGSCKWPVQPEADGKHMCLLLENASLVKEETHSTEAEDEATFVYFWKDKRV